MGRSAILQKRRNDTRTRKLTSLLDTLTQYYSNSTAIKTEKYEEYKLRQTNIMPLGTQYTTKLANWRVEIEHT